MDTINVVAAVIIEDGKILCTQRGSEKSLPYKWEFPGGKVELGEKPEEALIREIREELGCKISIRQYLLTTEHDYGFAIVKIDAFLCELIDEEPQCLEHNEICWLEQGELQYLDWAEADLPIVSILIHQK